MNLRDTPEQAQFRERLRTWLITNLPAEPEPGHLAERFSFMVAWQQALYAGGWTALSWPKEYGGQGLGPAEEAIFNEELGAAGAPTSLPLSYLGRVLLSHGTEEQRAAYLPDLLAARVIWCQGFSEPDAGSDLAALTTRATPVADGWVLSGRKLWTSFGAFADMCLLLARTSKEGRKHEGLSAFLMPMDAPGVTVRGVVMANGDDEFAEIFIDDVHVQSSALLGAAGDGWEIAQSTISFERGALDLGYGAKFARMFGELLDEVGERALHDVSVQRRLGEVAALLEVLHMHSLRRLGLRIAEHTPGPESSVDKLLMTMVEQNLLAAAMDLCDDHASELRTRWFDRYVYGRAGSIYGGSSQIQRNILASRVLGLGARKVRK